jgi:2-phosphoglycerate kinase
MARALAATGLSLTRAYELTRRAEAEIVEDGERLDLDRFGELAEDMLGSRQAATTVGRLRRLHALNELDLPIVLLVGGGTGTGKSTLATEVAHRLGITRVTSTDFIRQTMRALFSRELMPSVHFSSFEAALALTKAEEEESGDAVLLGFLDQTRNVLVGVEAAIERALAEGWSMVLEGVHLVPGIVEPSLEGALAVHVVVEIPDEDMHRVHFHVRDASTGGVRPMDKYLERLDDIRRVQTYISGRARREGVPVVENVNVERTIDSVIELVMQAAERLKEPA